MICSWIGSWIGLHLFNDDTCPTQKVGNFICCSQSDWLGMEFFNIFRPEQNGWHCAYDILKCIYLVLLMISLHWLRQCFIISHPHVHWLVCVIMMVAYILYGTKPSASTQPLCWLYSENARVCAKWQWNAQDCVTGLHDRRSRECNPVTPVECVSLLFRTHPCVLAFIIHILCIKGIEITFVWLIQYILHYIFF